MRPKKFNRHLRNNDYSAADRLAREGIGSGDAPAQQIKNTSLQTPGKAIAAEQSPFYHSYTCSECGIVIACECLTPARHAERADHGWADRCDKCEKVAQAGWFGYLKSNPETRIYDPTR